MGLAIFSLFRQFTSPTVPLNLKFSPSFHKLILLLLLSLRGDRQAGIVGWSNTMIEKQRVPGSSPAWKRKDFSSRAATHS